MFAIIVSSILFGLMHANVVQIVFAFFVGLVLAYITEEYSIKWAILIHIINNFVFAELTGIAGKIVGETFEILLTNSFVVGFFVVGVLTLWKNREAIAEYLDKNREPAEKYIYAFTTVPLAIFTIVNLLLALAAIQPLGS